MILADYLINGQDLTIKHSSLIVGTTHFTSISPRINSVSVNGRNGILLPAGPVAFDAPEITLKFITDGHDADALMHRFYRLCRLASTLTRVEKDTTTGLTRRMTANAVCTSCQPDGDEIPWSNHRAATAVFRLPDVFWQGDWRTVSLTASGGALLDGDGVAWLSNAPVTSLVARFGAATSVTLADPVSGTDLLWSGTRDASKPYLFLDAESRKAWLSNSPDAWSGGTDASNGVDWTAEPLQVWPSIDSGAYRLSVRQSGTSSGVTVRFKTSWE